MFRSRVPHYPPCNASLHDKISEAGKAQASLSRSLLCARQIESFDIGSTLEHSCPKFTTENACEASSSSFACVEKVRPFRCNCYVHYRPPTALDSSAECHRLACAGCSRREIRKHRQTEKTALLEGWHAAAWRHSGGRHWTQF